MNFIFSWLKQYSHLRATVKYPLYIYKLLLTTNFFPEKRKASKVNQTLLVSKPTNFTRSMPFPQPMSKNVEDFVIFSLLFIHLTILVMLLSPNLLKKGTVPKCKNI